MKLCGKKAVLTGGSGGIGISVARQLLCEKATLVIVDIDTKSLSSNVADLKKYGEVEGLVADVSQEADVQKISDYIAQKYQSIDVLINAAGIQGPIGPFVESDIREWIRNLYVNLLGTVFCCRAFLPAMVLQKKGKIINFAGGGSTSPRPYFSAYGVSKTAVIRFTETIAEELKLYNIQVNAVSPGVIKTRMIEEILQAGPERAGDEYRQLRIKPEHKYDSPDNVAGLVSYLASDDSSKITGKVISAIWDPWREWQEHGPPNIDQDLYVLRRIDLRNFVKTETA